MADLPALWILYDNVELIPKSKFLCQGLKLPVGQLDALYIQNLLRDALGTAAAQPDTNIISSHLFKCLSVAEIGAFAGIP